MDASSWSITGILDELLTQDPKISSVLGDLKMFDKLTYTHCMRVSLLAGYIGKEFGLAYIDHKQLMTSALMHDIGKTHIPLKILRKPASLTRAEMDIMKRHPFHSCNVLFDTCKLQRELYDAVLYHHERCDGSGYLGGLPGNDIPFYAKIIAVADTYDAITSDRPYSPAKPQAEAAKYMKYNCTNLFDTNVLNALMSLVDVPVLRKAECLM
jgi:HD-GYP domain-containing protein (c-di-GMP phosphodiesterase class II)